MGQASLSGERRRAARQPAPPYALAINGQPASLVDWSFGGLGVRMSCGLDRIEVGMPVVVAVYCERTGGWETLKGRIQRIDRPRQFLGIAIEDDGAGSVRVLIELAGDRTHPGPSGRTSAFTDCSPKEFKLMCARVRVDSVCPRPASGGGEERQGGQAAGGVGYGR